MIKLKVQILGGFYMDKNKNERNVEFSRDNDLNRNKDRNVEFGRDDDLNRNKDRNVEFSRDNGFDRNRKDR